MKILKSITKALALCSIVLFIGINTNKLTANALEYKDTYRDGSLLSSISVPHGPHYSYLQNDNQRFLYDLIYKIMAPSIMHKDDELIFYSIGEVPSRGYYSYLNNGYDIVFAHEAVKYDNPNRAEFSLCPWEFSYKRNASNTFDAYISAGQGDIGSYNSMNAQLDAAADSLINSAQSLGLIDLSSDESKKMSLFKLALYMAPCQPLNNNYFKNADDYDWWGIVYNWDAKKDTLNEYPHTAYAALCDKYAVCDGVSMAYMYVLKKLGINECVCIDGFYGTDHAWNLIKLNNYWYDIDVTNMTINGIEFANGEINKRRLDRLFGIAMPASSGSRNIGTELGEKYIAERAGQYGFRQDSSSQESDNSSSSESTSGTENASNSSTGSTSSPSGNGNNGSNTSVVNNASDDTQESTSQQSDVNIPAETTKVVPATPKSVSAKVSKKTVTVKWKKQTKNTTGYEIQYSTDKKFKKNLKTVTVKKSATKTTVKKLKAKKTYYVRIRTVCKQNGKNVYSKWSKVQKVKIK